MATETEVAAVIYTNEDVDSTPFRCCLAADDFIDNINACDEEVTTFDEYEYDPSGPPGMRCTEISYSQTDSTARAPGAIARIITIMTGEPVETSR